MFILFYDVNTRRVYRACYKCSFYAVIGNFSLLFIYLYGFKGISVVQSATLQLCYLRKTVSNTCSQFGHSSCS